MLTRIEDKNEKIFRETDLMFKMSFRWMDSYGDAKKETILINVSTLIKVPWTYVLYFCWL